MSYMTQFDMSGVVGGAINQITPDAGVVVVPVGNNVDILGGNVLTTTGAGDTLTIDLDNGTDGQVLIGGGVDPAWATITSTGSTIAFVTGANTLDMDVGVTVPTSFPTDGGTATPAANALTVAGGTGITTSGAGATVTVTLDTPVSVANGGTGLTTITDHGVMVGSGVAAVTALAVGTDGQVLIGATGADPALATLTSADSSVVFATGANTLDLTVDVAAAGGVETLTGDAGGAISPTAAGDIGILGGTNISTSGAANAITVNLDAAISLATSVTSPLYTVASGDLVLNMTDDAGANSVSFTNDSDAQVASIDSLGAASFTNLDVDNININGNVISSTDTNGDITLTPDGTGAVNISYLTQYTLPIAGASGEIADLADGLGSSGQVLTSNGAGAEPSWEDASGGGMTWNEETGTSATMSVDNGYIANNAGLVTLTLPTTAAVGSIVRVVGKGAGGWRIAQNASEIIHFGASDTTTGVGGYLEFTQQYDAVELVCIVADTEWVVISSIGNITVV